MHLGFPLYVSCYFALAAFNFLSLCLLVFGLLSMCLDMFLLWFTLYETLCFLDLINYFLSHIGEISTIIFSKFFSYPFFCSSSSGTSIMWMLVHLILFQRSLKLSSVLFFLFTLFCCSAVISTILSFNSLIHYSASDILLLIPFKVFLISVIVLFDSVCLFFISSLLNHFSCVQLFVTPCTLAHLLLLSMWFSRQE